MENLLAIHKVHVSTDQGRLIEESLILEDSGSTHNFINHELAHQLDLAGEQVDTRVDDPKEQQELRHTGVYSFSLTDTQ